MLPLTPAIQCGLFLLAVLGHGTSWVFVGYWPGAWIGQISFLLLMASLRPKVAFGVGLLLGTLALGWAFHWAPEALRRCLDAPSWLAYGLFAALTVWAAVQFALTGWLIALCLRLGARGLWLIPCAWVAAEHFWPAIFPWMLGYTQMELLPLVQIADTGGAAAVGFCMTAACTIPLVCVLAAQYYARGEQQIALSYLGVTFVLLVSVVVYGYRSVDYWKNGAQLPQFAVAAIQIDVCKKDSEIELLEVTRRLENSVDVVIWPESAVGIYSDELSHFRDLETTRRLSRDSFSCLRPTEGSQTNVLMGGKTYTRAAGHDGPYSMTAFLVNSREEIIGKYNKRTLLPFGEYIPGQTWFPFLRTWATLREVIEPGKSAAPLLTSRGAKLGVIICYEDLIRYNSRQSVAEGAEILISIINDGSFINPLTLEQHYRLSLMRSVENRRTLVRCAGTGVSAIVLPTGEVVQELGANRRGILRAEVPLNASQTIYTRYGDVLPWFCLFALAGAFAYRRFETR